MNAPHSTNNHKQSYPNQRQSRERVLIVAHGDGWFEAFAEPHVDIRFETAPYEPTLEGEILAEKLIELNLPHQYRKIYWPGKLRVTYLQRLIKPSEIAWREYELALMRSIGEAGRILRGEDLDSDAEVVTCLM